MGDIDWNEDRDEDARREAIDERLRSPRGCLCGYPDWPDRCPGPAACPVHGQEYGDEETDGE